MNLEKIMKVYKNENVCMPREEKILEAIQKSKEVLIEIQQENLMNYPEFLLSQFRLIRKRWWMTQLLLLMMTSFVMPYMQNQTYIMKTLGIIGVLFVVMVIPEFWRNKTNDSLQVEATCLFSLRQIYSARIFLIGIVDVFMLTLFLAIFCIYLRMQFMDVLVQFLFPIVVAAGICFSMLCSKFLNEVASILGCFLWSVIWWSMVLNDYIYERITIPVWCALFAIAVVFLLRAVYKTIYDCNRYLEVNLNEITNG